MLDRLRHATEVTKFKADQLLRVNRVQGEISNLRREIHMTRDQIAGAAIPAELPPQLIAATWFTALIAKGQIKR